MLDHGNSGRLGQAELATADIESAVGLVAAELLEQTERLQIDLQGVDSPAHWSEYADNMVSFPTPRAAVGAVARLLQTLVQNVIQPPLGPYTTPLTTDALAVVEERLNKILGTLGFMGEGPTGPGFDMYAETFTGPSMEVIRADIRNGYLSLALARADYGYEGDEPDGL